MAMGVAWKEDWARRQVWGGKLMWVEVGGVKVG